MRTPRRSAAIGSKVAPKSRKSRATGEKSFHFVGACRPRFPCAFPCFATRSPPAGVHPPRSGNGVPPRGEPLATWWNASPVEVRDLASMENSVPPRGEPLATWWNASGTRPRSAPRARKAPPAGLSGRSTKSQRENAREELADRNGSGGGGGGERGDGSGSGSGGGRGRGDGIGNGRGSARGGGNRGGNRAGNRGGKGAGIRAAAASVRVGMPVTRSRPASNETCFNLCPFRSDS
jgi:hypothetical protein